jgi:hypothetical protein
MDFKKDWQEILNGIADLPLELQDIVAQDIVESAKNRIATIKRIVDVNEN